MELIIPFLIIMLLILINGLFVAAEFAIIGVRASRIEQLASEGSSLARRVQHILKDSHRTDRYVATAQLGITVASLGLGMYAEPSIAHFIEYPLEQWFGLEGVIVHTISFIIALTLITYLHVVIGEMVPKSLALNNPEKVVLALSTMMSLIERVLSLPVTLLNSLGMVLLKVLRVSPPSKESRFYSADELGMIVSESYAGGLLEEHEQALVANIFDFTSRRAVQVMTPRTLTTTIPVEISEKELIALTVNSPHSRFPVYAKKVDKVIGMLHIKDFVRQHISEKPYNLRGILREVPFVPETALIEDVLEEFRNKHLHMAIVLDEFGGMLGLVTLEDLIEEVFGEVRDEFDQAEAPPAQLLEPGNLIAQGTFLLDDLEDYRIDLGDIEYDVNTLGGLVLAVLSRPPAEGDEIEINGIKITVTRVQDLSVREVSVKFPV